MTLRICIALAVLALSSAACGTATTQVASAGVEAPAEAAPPCGADDEGCRAARVGDDGLGWLTLGLSVDALEARLGPPDEVGPTFQEGATGLWVHDRVWADAGVVAQLAATTEDGPLTVDSVTVTPPFAEKTRRGVGLGSTEAAVRAAYRDALDPYSEPGVNVIAGSLFGGIIFYLEDGVVTSIFVGAAAE